MKKAAQLLRLWQNLGITAKFALAFALLLGMLLLEAVVGLAALGVVRNAESVILTSAEIRQRVFEMDGALEKARRLHRDFFLHYPHMGFMAAQELYFRPSTEVIDQVVSSSEELKRLIEGSQVSATLRERNNDLTLYLSTARRFAESFRDLVSLVTELAAPGTGLENRLEDVEGELLRAVRPYPPALLIFREVQIQQRTYMLNRQRPSMQSALNACFALRHALDAQSMPAEARAKAQAQLARYVDIAQQIPDVDVSIRGKLNDFTLQAKAVDPISANLKTLATAEVERARARINAASRIATLIIVATAVTALVFMLLVAAIIQASVTRRIMTLTRSAEQMRAGNLATSVDQASADEIGVLSASFNDMSGRMRELVSNLEQAVAARTAELTTARDRLVVLVRELDEKNQALEILSVTDRLTGLANRRKLEATLQAELLRAKRYGKTFSVILMDVDRFKAVNDTYGHQVGDTVLVQLADILRAKARETDTVGRWGGEEFLVVCPETDIGLVTALAERYRVEMEQHDFGQAGHVTSSFGVTACQQGDDFTRLMQRADVALYRAKETGRNRVEAEGLRALH